MKKTTSLVVFVLAVLLCVFCGYAARALPPKPKTAPAKPVKPGAAPLPTARASATPAGPLTMMPPRAHAGMKHALASPDGRLVASSGIDEVRIWESETGRTTRALPCSGVIYWMKDSRRLLVGGGSARGTGNEKEVFGTLQLWDTVTGKALRIWEFPSVELDALRYVSEVTGLDVTNDEARALVTTAGVGQAFVCDLATGATPIKLTERTGVYSGHFLPGDREFAIYYVSRGYEKKIRQTDRYDILTGKKQGTLPVAAPVSAYSSQGLVFVNEAYKDLLGIKSPFNNEGKEDGGFVIEEATGKVIRSVANGFAGFSPDGKSLLRIQGSRFSRIHLATGKETVSQPPAARGIVVEEIGADAAPPVTAPSAPLLLNDDVIAVSSRADGKQMVSVTRDGRATLWSGDSLVPQNSLRGWSHTPEGLYLSPDGKTMLAATSSGQQMGWRLLDTATGQTRLWMDNAVSILNAVYTADGESIFVLSTNAQREQTELRRLDRVTGALSDPWFVKKDAAAPYTLVLSSDGTSLFALGRLFDVASGRERAQIAFMDKQDASAPVTFNEKNELVVCHQVDENAKGWEFVTYAAQTGARLSRSPGWLVDKWKGEELQTETFPEPIFVEGGKALLSYVYSGFATDVKHMIARRDVATGKITQVWDSLFPDGAVLREMVLIAGGEKVALFNGLTWEWSIRDVRTGKQERLLTNIAIAAENGEAMQAPQLLPDGRHFITMQRDETVRLRDLTGKTKLSFLMLEGGEWLAYTPSGAFDGSQKAIEKVYFSSGARTYSLDQFAERFYRPGLVPLVSAGKEGVDPLSPEAALAQGTPPRVQFAPALPTRTGGGEVMVTLQATEQNSGGVRAVRLYHNGRLVGGESRLTSAGKAQSKRSSTFTVALEPGANRLRAVAYSRTNLESQPAEWQIVCTAPPPARPTLRVLSIGINKYDDPAMNLEYARTDAEALATFFKEQKALFADVKVTALLDEKATRQNIESALKSLAAAAKPSDIVVIYLAGHGETAAATPAEDKTEGASQSFYFLPAEMRLMQDKNNVRKFGISGEKLDALVSHVSARRILMVYDACKSGAALGGVTASGAQEQRQLALLARAQGLYILTASTSQQYASEVKALGHGILTYAMLEGLRGKASPTESQVKVISLLAYAEQRVPALARELRNRDQRPVRYGRGVNFPLAGKGKDSPR